PEVGPFRGSKFGKIFKIFIGGLFARVISSISNSSNGWGMATCKVTKKGSNPAREIF
ncbi:hypothetical protein C0J52_18935, partial [Blattella germanica]